MIGAVRRLLSDGDNRILMPGDISNAWGSIDMVAVLRAVRLHAPQTGSSLCLTILDGRDESGHPRKREPRRRSLARKAPLSSGTLSITFRSRMDHLMTENNRYKPAGFISHADDVVSSTKQAECECNVGRFGSRRLRRLASRLTMRENRL